MKYVYIMTYFKYFLFVLFFQIASQNGHKDVVQLLINNNANVNEKDNKGWTSLMIGKK